LLAAASPPQEKPSTAGSGGSGAAAPDYRAEVSEVHTQLAASNIGTFLARSSQRFAGEAEYSSKQDNCAAFNEALPVQQRLPRGGESSDYRAEVSEVYKHLAAPNIGTFLARDSKPYAGEAERSRKWGFGGGSPRLPRGGE